ncbi:hypothetical protein ES703_05381 [subsurface metagenome]
MCAVKIRNFLKGRKMKNTKILAILVLAMGPVVWSGQATSPGSMHGWGQNNYGQSEAPAGSDFVAIGAGSYHSLALKSDGSIVGWGYNAFDRATPPAGNDFVAVAAGSDHSLALKVDGSIVGWGQDSMGQATPPDGTDFVAIAAGDRHSLALKSDGSIVGWGSNLRDQASPPAGTDFVAVAAGYYHSLARKSDGSIVGWGYNSDGQATPPEDSDFVAIAAGAWHSLALRVDGSIVGWGDNDYGQVTLPAGNYFVAIASGARHGLALKSDGSIVGWGDNNAGQVTSPVGNDFVAIAGGLNHSLAIKATPSGGPGNDWIVSGDNMYSVPTGNVGIGTTSPEEKLHVSGGNIRIDYGSGIHIIQQSGHMSAIQPYYNDLKILNFAAGDIWFSTGTGGGSAQLRLLIVNDGNVGIGTTSPAEKLEVSGNIKVSGFGNGLIFPDGTRQITAGAGGGGGGGDGGWMVSGNNMYSIPSGNVGIGTVSPHEKLDVAGALNLNEGIYTGVALRVNRAEALWYNGDYFSWGFGGTANFFADGVGIGQVDPGPHKLYVNGTGYATGGFWASDLRFKKNIRTIDSPIDKISNIRGVSFEWKRSEYQDKGLPEGEHYGVIAQEIEQVLPEIVKEGPNGDKAVSYTELVPILTEAIKEQQKQLEEQQKQIEYLLQRVESLERFVQQQQFALAEQTQQ